MDRYFFHSFPRDRPGEARSAQLAKGLLIADSLLRNGLLLTPEVHEVPIVAPNGVIIDRLKATQRRICFTELEPSGLPQHSETFGPFALAFKIEDLRRLGALPVFYIPLQTSGGYLSALATEILGGFTDSSRIIESLLAIRRHLAGSPTVKLDYRGRSVEFSADFCDAIRFFIDVLMDSARTDLGATDGRLRAAASCFYPTENPKYTEPLHYYRQREWRIIGGSFTYQGVEPSVKATPQQVEELLAIDPVFFAKELNFPNPRSGVGGEETDTIGRRSHFFRSVGDLETVACASYFIYPTDCSPPEELVQRMAALNVVAVRQSEFSGTADSKAGGSDA